MFTYEAVKIGNRFQAVATDSNGNTETVCHWLRTKAEVLHWIERRKILDVKEAAYAIERRARRVEIVTEYLARRADRSSAKQLSLFAV